MGIYRETRNWTICRVGDSGKLSPKWTVIKSLAPEFREDVEEEAEKNVMAKRRWMTPREQCPLDTTGIAHMDPQTVGPHTWLHRFKPELRGAVDMGSFS